jgi:TolB-like protein
MNKKMAIHLLLPVIFINLLLISCVTNRVGNNRSEILVMFGTNDWSIFSKLNVYIDGVRKAKIKSGNFKRITIPDGQHIISVDWQMSLLGISISSAESRAVQFNAASNRIVFKVELHDELRPGEEPDRSDSVRYRFDLILTLDSIMNIYGTAIMQNPFEDSIYKSYKTISGNLPDAARIAIVDISSDNADEGEFVFEELTMLFVNAKRFTVVGRKNIEDIKNEQNFQMSGDVDDATAVSIGHFLGAEVVVVGKISGDGSRKRLRLKTIDVETAKVIQITAERF